jgi:predicted glycosyltransferase
MKFFYHAINGTGLGHLMRLTAIACRLREKKPVIHQYFATNSRFVRYLEDLGFPFVQLPENNVVSPGGILQSPRKSVNRKNTVNLYHIIKEHDPDVVIFDTHFSPTLVRQLEKEGKRSVLILRECREHYIYSKLEDGIFDYFSRILVPHEPETFRLVLSHELLARLEALPIFRYTGPVVRPVTLSREKIEIAAARYGIPSDSLLILITCGAGGYISLCRQFLERACLAAQTMKQHHQHLCIMAFAGPYLGPVQVDCSLIDWEPELPLLMARANLVVAHGGYNTVHEILLTGTPAVLVPMRRKNENQSWRIRTLAREGRIKHLHLNAPLSCYQRCFEETMALPKFKPRCFHGAEQAAEELLEFCHLFGRKPSKS